MASTAQAAGGRRRDDLRSGPVATDSYALGPRARALLRGKDMASDDLKLAGGAYTLDEVCRLLNDVSRQRIDQLVRQGALLAVPGPSNRRRYPAVQFNDDGTLVEGLERVQSALPTRNPWLTLNFLIHSDDRLQGRVPIDLLRAGQTDEVVHAAERMAEMGA